MARFVLALLVVSFFSQSDVVMRRSNGCPLGSGSSECKPCLRAGSEPGKETYNKSPDVTEITLEKSELHIPPRKENEPRPVFSDELMVGVTVTAEDPEGDVLTYNYTISGGRIVGTGKKVSWSLNGVQPGTYTITAGVDDGCGVCGKTMTQSLTISEDASDQPKCECPQISISHSPPDTGPRRYELFTANLNGNVPKGITYNWTISTGTLHSGQGTSSINVLLPEGHSSGTGTVTVEIGGLDPNCSCTSSISKSY